jgi:hypothetical protein
MAKEYRKTIFSGAHRGAPVLREPLGRIFADPRSCFSLRESPFSWIGSKVAVFSRSLWRTDESHSRSKWEFGSCVSLENQSLPLIVD